MEKTEAGFPTSSSDRVLQLRALDTDVDRLGLGGLELGLRLEHVCPGCNAARIPVLRQFEDLLVGGDRRVQKLLLGIERAELKIVLCQLRPERASGPLRGLPRSPGRLPRSPPPCGEPGPRGLVPRRQRRATGSQK